MVKYRPTCLSVANIIAFSLIVACYFLIVNNKSTNFSTSLLKYADDVTRRCGSKGRSIIDGRWISQSNPFPLHVYSAFYDDRWSNGPRISYVVVIHNSPDSKKIKHCLLWYGTDDECFTENHASKFIMTVALVHSNIILCPSPLQKVNTHHDTSSLEGGTASGSERRAAAVVPRYVSLAWRNTSNEATAFRIPVERVNPLPAQDDTATAADHPKTNRHQRKSLAVCASVLYGDAVDPRLLVEWFEIQRLLGVELVLIYNHSVSDRVGRIVADYAAREPTNEDGFQVELLQTRRFDTDKVGPRGREWFGREHFRHQSPLLSDCYYRLAGRFRYIGVYDIDEVVVPLRSNASKIMDLIKV
jgi:Glycosyltransferase family 92